MGKFYLNACLLLCTCCLLYGCPYSSQFPLDEVPKEAVQKSLLGQWTWLDKATEEKTMIYIGKKNDMEYNISVTGSIKAFTPIPLRDSIRFTAWSTTIDKNIFWNIFYNSRYYLVQVIEKDGRLSFLPLSEHFTAMMVRSNAQLRNLVGYHMKTRLNPSYDEDIRLPDMQR